MMIFGGRGFLIFQLLQSTIKLMRNTRSKPRSAPGVASSTEKFLKRCYKRLTAEFCISSSMRHPNVIATLDLLLDTKGVYCQVMELCSGGDLHTVILTAGQLEETEADCFFKQLMRGVGYMHEMGVARRDLKLENILLTQRGTIKITDFGNAECFRTAWE
jgi:protein-serine/threonine kinase